jgi:hypothetical protein
MTARSASVVASPSRRIVGVVSPRFVGGRKRNPSRGIRGRVRRHFLSRTDVMSNDFQVLTLTAFLLHNGFLAVCTGQVIGQVFLRFVNSIVTDVTIPAMYWAVRQVYPNPDPNTSDYFDNLFRSMKTTWDPMSLSANTFIMITSVAIVYVVVKIAYLQLIKYTD